MVYLVTVLAVGLLQICCRFSRVPIPLQVTQTISPSFLPSIPPILPKFLFIHRPSVYRQEGKSSHPIPIAIHAGHLLSVAFLLLFMSSHFMFMFSHFESHSCFVTVFSVCKVSLQSFDITPPKSFLFIIIIILKDDEGGVMIKLQ